MSDKKKNRVGEQVKMQLTTDPELGKVVTLSGEGPRTMRTPLPYETRPTAQFDTGELGELALSISDEHSTRQEHSTTELSSAQIAEEVARASKVETGSLHRVKDHKECHTVEWAHDDITALVQDEQTQAARESHPTRNISDLELGVMLDNQNPDLPTKDVPGEGKTVRWNRNALPEIVSDVEAAALIEISSVREDGHALLDEEDRRITQHVEEEMLDDILAQATAQRPRQGGQRPVRPTPYSPHPPKISLWEEHIPAMSRSPQGTYISLHNHASEAQGTSRNQRIVIVFLVVIVLLLVGNMCVMMWPKTS